MRLQFFARSLPYSNRILFVHSFSLSTGLRRWSLNPVAFFPPQDQIYAHLLEICLDQCKKIKNHNPFDEMPKRLTEASRTGKAVHAHSLRLGLVSKISLGNAILDLYAKCGAVGFAENAFDMLERKDVLAWNSILSMHSRHGSPEQICKNFRSMLNFQVLPNEFTFSIVLSACARSVDFKFGRQVHCDMIKMGLESSSYSGAALIDMYAKCHFVSDARGVFDVLVDPDTVSWTSMIAGYVQAGLPEESLKLFEEMQNTGHKPDMVAFVTVLNACVSLGRLDDACELFSQMPNQNVVAWNVMISGNAQRGYEVEAIDFFRNMRKSGVKSTRSTLGSVLSAIGNIAALDLGLAVHAEAVKQGLSSNVFVGSSLISMYSKCQTMDAAKKVFEALDEKNIVLWNAMLGGYAQTGNAHEVMELFADMKCSGFDPDDFTFTSILSACASLQNLELGSQLHTAIIKKKFAANLFVGNALVDMYAKCGALEEARQKFERIRNRDSISWNAIIVGYVQEEDESEAFNLFKRMNLSGIIPDEACLASVLSACASIQGLDQGKQFHCLSVKCSLESSIFAGSSLIDMYAKCGAIVEAHKVFSLMPKKSVVSMNALIAGYSQNSLHEAVALFREMQVEGLNPSEVTFASLLGACDGLNNLIFGTEIHSHVIKRGISCDDEFLGISLMGMYMDSHRVTEAHALFSEFSNPKSRVLWTAIISGYNQNDFNEEALAFYKDMRSDNSLPDQATFVSVLRACAILSSLKQGRTIHSLIFHTGYHLDELTSSSLVDMYAKCGDVTSSAQVFDEMMCKTNVITWNSMIVGFAKNGYAEDALRIFNQMTQKQVKPDEITFLGVLTSCSHAGKVSEGRQIFDMMVNYYRIKPRVDHCACMVDLLGRWGYLKEAEDLIEKLNLETDAKIWASLLGACRIHGDDIRGKTAAEKLIELEPKNSAAYVLLSNIYASQGHWEKVNTLRRAMKDRGVKKSPGFSWIGVGQSTHLFVAGDKSHPHADQIEFVLKDLSDMMKDDVFVNPDIDSAFHDHGRE